MIATTDDLDMEHPLIFGRGWVYDADEGTLLMNEVPMPPKLVQQFLLNQLNYELEDAYL